MDEYRTPMKAIRAKCLDCVCFQKEEVKKCTMSDCPLHPYRLGKNPYLPKREMTDEQREAARERMKKLRETQLAKKS